MKLIKEVEKNDNSESIKRYNINGQVTYTLNCYVGWSLTQEYFYDNDGKLEKVIEAEFQNNEEEKRLKAYEYTGDNYRILTYKTHHRGYEDITTFEHLILGQEKWHSDDKLIAVHEFKYENQLLISERLADFNTFQNYHYSYSYQNKLKIKEVKCETDGTVYTNHYNYENGILTSQETFINDKFSHKEVFYYDNGLLIDTKTYRRWKSEEYLSAHVTFQYDNKGSICRVEKYSRYKADMVLYYTKEVVKDQNIETTTISEISYFDLYTGYYDLSCMRQEIPEEFRKDVTETMFDNASFDNNIKTIEVYDHKGSVVESTTLESDTSEVYQKLIYHNEYNEQGLIEFSVCFSQCPKDGSLETSTVKKYYYSET